MCLEVTEVGIPPRLKEADPGSAKAFRKIGGYSVAVIQLQHSLFGFIVEQVPPSLDTRALIVAPLASAHVPIRAPWPPAGDPRDRTVKSLSLRAARAQLPGERSLANASVMHSAPGVSGSSADAEPESATVACQQSSVGEGAAEGEAERPFPGFWRDSAGCLPHLPDWTFPQLMSREAGKGGDEGELPQMSSPPSSSTSSARRSKMASWTRSRETTIRPPDLYCSASNGSSAFFRSAGDHSR